MKKFRNFRVWMLVLILSACSTATPTAVTPPTGMPEATHAPAASTTPAQSGLSFTYQGVSFITDPSLATSARGQVVPAKNAAAEAPYWEVHPEYTSILLEGYPVAGSTESPLITVYPVEEFRSMSEPARKTLDDLAQFLNEKPADSLQIPALPVRNSVQSLRSNVKFLDFQNGHGVRFLAFYTQGLVQVNNAEIFYTFQGLTNDGRYVVSVIMPVNHPNLPATAQSQTAAGTTNSAQQYYADLSAKLSAQPDDSFTPDLAKLDVIIQSLNIALGGG
jgi:hypothetical protein